MEAKRCGMAATIGGVAVTWLCLASSDDGQSAGRDGVVLAASTPSFSAAQENDLKSWLSGALAGDPHAAFKLGRAYAEGSSRSEDYAEAARWLRRAAQSGHGAAQADLAMLYGKGLGVPQDYVWSYAWFAAAAANMPFGRARDQALELRDMMAAFLTPEQRPRAERLAKQLMDLPGHQEIEN
jgi:TPR repeat protein